MTPEEDILARLNTIERKSNENGIKLDNLQATLTLHLSDYEGHKKDVHGAFIKDVETGEPDFHGHRWDHKERRDSAETIKDHKKKVLGGLLGAAIIASVTFASQAVWEAVKRGVMK